MNMLRRRMMMGQGGGKRLPDGYTELRYVECNGNQYLNTGVNVTDTIEIETSFMPNTTTYSYFICVARDSQGQTRAFRRLEILLQPSSTSHFDFFYSTSLSGYARVSAATPINVWQKVKMNDSDVTINGVVYDYILNSATRGASMDYPIVIAADNHNGSISSSFKGCIAETILRDNGLTLKDYVPAMDSNGKIGFYDLVNDSFHESESGTAFIAGPVK